MRPLIIPHWRIFCIVPVTAWRCEKENSINYQEIFMIKVRQNLYGGEKVLQIGISNLRFPVCGAIKMGEDQADSPLSPCWTSLIVRLQCEGQTGGLRTPRSQLRASHPLQRTCGIHWWVFWASCFLVIGSLWLLSKKPETHRLTA